MSYSGMGVVYTKISITTPKRSILFFSCKYRGVYVDWYSDTPRQADRGWWEKTLLPHSYPRGNPARRPRSTSVGVSSKGRDEAQIRAKALVPRLSITMGGRRRRKLTYAGLTFGSIHTYEYRLRHEYEQRRSSPGSPSPKYAGDVET